MKLENKNKFSFVERYPFKYILSVCLFLVFLDTLDLLKPIFVNQKIGSNSWFSLSIGIILIFMGIIKIKYKFEKLGIIILGIGFILSYFKKTLEYQAWIFFIILLNLIGLYCFWLVNKGLNSSKVVSKKS